MGSAVTQLVRFATEPFSHWAQRVQAEASASIRKGIHFAYSEEAIEGQPCFYSAPCLTACCSLLTAVDAQCLMPISRHLHPFFALI